MSRLSPTTPRRRKLLPAWPGRRHLRVKVQPLALAALAALGAAAPMVSGQTVIVPIGSGAGATQTVVSSQGNQHQISTATLRDGNAFSTYSQFQVGSGDVATLRMPQGANWWVNIVRDSRLRVDGTLESRISNGAIGGNVLFVDSHGMAVGPQGLINVGRFAFAAPSTAFVDRLLQGADAWSGASVSQVLSGQFDRSVTGVVDIEGRIQAIDGVSIMAGAGEGSPYAVRIPGAIVVQGRVAGSRVNLGELKSLTPLEDRDGVIDITTPGHLRLDGQLITDGSHWRAPGAVRVTAGQDMALGANSVASASGATGTDQAGGQVVFYAQNNMANEPGAQLRARGAGTGEGGFIEYSSAHSLLQNDLRFDVASDLGKGGTIYLDPEDLVITSSSGGLLTDGGNYSATATKSIKVTAGTSISTRNVATELSADPFTALSMGESGDITLKAPVILLERDTVLDATARNLASWTTLYNGGNVTLANADTPDAGAAPIASNSASSSSNPALIKGRNVTISAPWVLTGGGDLKVQATGNVTLSANAVVNTRKVANGSNPTTDSVASIGNSGKVTVNAVNITTAAGSSVDASVVNTAASGDTPATTFTAGDISLSASDTSNWVTLLGFANANAKLDIGGTLKGKDVTLEASIESAAVYDGVSALLTQKALSLALEAVGSPINFSLAYTEAKGDAEVKIRPTAVVRASNNLTITSTAEREGGAELQVEGSSKANLSAGFTRVYGSNTLTIDGGADLKSDSDLSITAATKTKVTMTSTASGETEGKEANLASVVFGGSMSDVTTKVDIGRSASIESTDGNVGIQAYHGSYFDTTAKVEVYGKGTVGVVGALSLQKSSTTVDMAGKITAKGDVTVTSLHAAARNAVSATTQMAATQTPSLPVPESLQLSDDDSKAALLEAFIKLAEVASAAQEAKSGSGNNKSAFKLAGSLAWSESTHTTSAAISSATGSEAIATINAEGNVVVDAQTLVGALRGEAVSAANSAIKGKNASPVAVALSLNYGVHDFSTKATVGSKAALTGEHLAVHAATDVPEFYIASLPTEWGNFYQVFENIMTLPGSLYAGMNSRVGSTSSASGLAAAGSVNLTKIKTNTRAVVQSGASLTTNASSNTDPWSYTIQEVAFDSDIEKMLIGSPPYRLEKDLGVFGDFASKTRYALDDNGNKTSTLVDEVKFDRKFTGDAVVRAENHLQTIHFAGGIAPESGSGGGSIGGTFSMVERDNTAVAAIGDAVVVNARQLDVTANTSDWLLTISPTAGGGDGVAANGMVSYNSLNETTVASISREAKINTEVGTKVNADLSLWSFAVTGAITMSNNSGVGVGVSFNDMTGNTLALVGDNDVWVTGTDSAEGTQGWIASPSTQVNAFSHGTIGAVGVAAAVAGVSSPTSSSSSMGSKVQSKTGSSQSAAGGPLSKLPLLSALGDQLLAAGAANSAESGASSNNKPPPFSVAGAGAIVSNVSDIDTKAEINSSLIKSINSGTTKVDVAAISDLTQLSAAGGGALSVAKKPGTKFSSDIAGAVAIQKSDDDTTARIVDSTISDIADEAGAMKVQALKAGERTAVATGISANLSTTTKGDLTIAGSVSITDTTDGTLAEISGSSLTGAVTSATALDPSVIAYDRARIGSGGGSLSFSMGKGSAGMGAAISMVNLQGSTEAKWTNSSLSKAHDLSVQALSSQKVLSMGAVAGVQTSSTSVAQMMGAFVFNEIGNTVNASVSTSSGSINLTGDLLVRAAGTGRQTSLDSRIGAMRDSFVTDYEMASTENGYEADLKTAVGTGESILGVAGTLVIAAGGEASAGMSYAQNNIQTTYAATLGGTVTATGGVTVEGISGASINGIAAGAGVSKGKFTAMGSASINAMGQRTQASVSNATLTASSLTINSQTKGAIFGLAGNLTISMGQGGGAGGGAVSYNQTGTRTYTVTEDDGTPTTLTTRNSGNEAKLYNSTVSLGTGALIVRATQAGDIQAVAASGVTSVKSPAFAGTATVNELGDVTQALISGGTITAGTVSVSAGEQGGGATGKIQSLAGGLSASKGFSAALSFGFNTLTSQRKASISGATLTVGTSTSVTAQAQGSIDTLAATLVASAQSTAGGASSTVNSLDGSTEAEVTGSTFGGTMSSLTVQSEHSGRIHALAGTISGSSANAIGASVAINKIGAGADHDYRLGAKLASTTVNAPASITVQSDLSGEIKGFAVAGGGSGSGAYNGSATTNQIEGTVSSTITGLTQTQSGTDLKVKAGQSSNIFSFTGAISGAGKNAVGAADSINDIRSTVDASIGTSTARATGQLEVAATATGTIQSMAVGAAGSGDNAISGSFTTNSITSKVRANTSSLTQAVSSSSISVRATDNSTVESLAGGIAGSGGTAAGAGIALSYLGRTVENADAEKLVQAGVTNSTLLASGEVLVQASSTSTIRSIGVALGVGGKGALTGSNSTNYIEDTLEAKMVGGSLNGGTTSELKIKAVDNATIESLAGNISASVGTFAVGAAIAVNQINTDASTLLSGTSVTTGDALVHANTSASIDTLAVGMSASANAGVQGSVAVSRIGSSTTSLVNNGAVIQADDTVAVLADSRDRMKTLAGAIGIGVSGVGVAGGVQVNYITSTTSAGIDGATTTVNAAGNGSGLTINTDALTSSPDLMNITAVTDTVMTAPVWSTLTHKGVAVQATSIEQLGAVTSVTGGGQVGAGASVNANQISGTTRAFVNSAKINQTAGAHAEQDALVRAVDHALLGSAVATLAGGTTTGVSGAVAGEVIKRSTYAEVLAGADVRAVDDLVVKARSTNTIALVAVGAGVGGVAGVAGSGGVVLMNADTLAKVDASTLAAGDVTVHADAVQNTNLIAGAVAGGATAGVGLSFGVNVSGAKARALVKDTTIRADGDVQVLANNTTNELAVVATGSGGGVAGVAIGAVVTVLEGDTQATIEGTSSVTRRSLASTISGVPNNASVTISGTGFASYDMRLTAEGGSTNVDAGNHAAFRFVLKRTATEVDEAGVATTYDRQVSLGDTAQVRITDGTRWVTATANADGSYTANLSSLGDGALRAVVYTKITSGSPDPSSPSAALALTKSSGVNALKVAATENVSINHNAGAGGFGGSAGVGTSANVVIGRSKVQAQASGSQFNVGNALEVTALRVANVDMLTITAGGGGLAGVTGAVGVLIFGSAPSTDSQTELNSGDSSTLARVNGATSSSRVAGTGTGLSSGDVNSMNSSGSYDTKAAFGGASGAHMTSAILGSGTITAGTVTVSSLDKTSADNNAGGIAGGGYAGISAGVAITQLGGANAAAISAGTLRSRGAITVESGTRTPSEGTPAIDSRAVSGAGGFVGVGAAVSVASNETANTATLSGTVTSGGLIRVKALDQATMDSSAFGATVGAISVGVVVSTAEQKGTVTTTVGGNITGVGLDISAAREGDVKAKAIAGSAGVAAGVGAGATATDTGTVSVVLSSNASLNAGTGSLSIAAKASPAGDSQAIGVAVGGAAVGASIALSTASTDVLVSASGALSLSGAQVNVSSLLGSENALLASQAIAGSGGTLLGATGADARSYNSGKARILMPSTLTLQTTGDATFLSNDGMRLDANATGVGVGGLLGIGVAISRADGGTTLSTQLGAVQGRVRGSLTVQAKGAEEVASQSVAGSGGVVAGAGAEARSIHDMGVSASMGVVSGQTLVVDGTVLIDAQRLVNYDTTTITATAAAFGASGAVANAELKGSASASLGNGSKIQATNLQINATNTLTRSGTGQNAEGGGGGVLSGAGADVEIKMSGDATATVGDNANLTLNNLLEVRAYNEMRGAANARMDVGGAIPIALVYTNIRADANADAIIGSNATAYVYGESYANAVSYIDIQANTISKTYGLAGAAQGNAYATAVVNDRVNVGNGTKLISVMPIWLLAGQDRVFNRNKHFVTASADLFNHSAIPVSINPDADARLTLNNSLTVTNAEVRSGGTISLGGVEGTYVVEGKGKVSDWTRDVGELMGISSEYGTSVKNLSSTAVLSGQFEAGFGNKQRLVIGVNGAIIENVGDIRYTITNEDIGASASAYIEKLYAQLARYGDVPEVKAFVEAELSFYFSTLLREGLAEEQQQEGVTVVVPKQGVAANFLNIKDLRAGSGNIELFGNNISGTASLTARADSEIYVENRSPLNLRVLNMTVDANGGFAKYNGTYLTKNADIATLNTSVKTTGLTISSIDTQVGGPSLAIPKLTVKNTYMGGTASSTEQRFTAPDGTWADMREDQIRPPELRVNGTLYNKLGNIDLINSGGSISVYAETPGYVPRVDGKEINISAGKNLMLSSPTVSQSVGGSPESLYAVHYSDDQKRTLELLGSTICGYARPGGGAPTFTPTCVVNGAGGVYADGGIFLGARYLNINGTVQSGRSDFSVTLTDDSKGLGPDNKLYTMASWRSTWLGKKASFTSSEIQISGPRATDSEAQINQDFATGKIKLSERNTLINEMATRRTQPTIFYSAELDTIKVMPANVQGGVVELVGSIINTGGGLVRALDGYAQISINNQSSKVMDLMGLSTGGDNGVVRITDLSKPIKTGGVVTSYEVTTYQRDANGVFKGITTAGRGTGATVIRTVDSSLSSPSGGIQARFTYTPLDKSTYSWTAGYEYLTEKRYWYSSSSWLGFIPGGSTSWDSVDTYVKTSNAMPEDVMVTLNVPLNDKSFSIETRQAQTAAEKQVYYRSWKKCGFLCIKKTYYIDRRTEVGMKDIFTQRVAADRPFNVEFIGYGTGTLNITSKYGIRLGGNIINDSGTVNITSTLGSISQLSGASFVQGQDLNFSARTGIGTMGSPINLITGAGFFNATSTSGDVAFHGNSGALRIKQVSTTGNVWLDGDESILGSGTGTHVSGNRIYLSAPRGSIGEFNADGSVKSLLRIQTRNSPNGGLTAYSRSGVAIRQATGNLWVNQVATGGDVYLEAGGDLIDNNRNETRDTRTEEQLLSIWSAAALQGSAADASNALSTDITVSQYQRYWSLRNVRSVVKNSSQVVTSYVADTVNDSYQFRFSSTERQAMLDSGVSEASIAATEASRTQEVKSLHAVFGTTQYQETRDNIIAAVNTANTAANKPLIGNMSTWSDAELNNPLPKAIFSKSSSDTTTRIEEPNVVGNRVVLKPGGKIGRDEGSVVIPLRRADRIARNMEGDLTDDERLAIMSAETTDMTLNKTTWTLTVLKKDTFNVLSNRLNVSSNGFVYLGADTTAAYPNGGTANLESVTGPGEIRIKVADSIYSAAPAGTTVISGQKAILEAASGNIGTAIKPVQISLTGGTLGTLTARAASDLFIHEIGDMRVSDIYAGASVNLSTTGAIIDARPVINIPNNGDRAIRSIQADQINLDARGGAVGASDNPIVVRVGDGGVSAFSARGSSIYVAGGEGGSLSVRNMISGKDVVLLSSYGGIANSGVVSAPGLIIANAQGPISGMAYTAGESITATAVGNLEGIQASAGAGNLTLSASSGGAVRLTTASSSRLVSINAGGEISLTTSSAGTDMNLSSLSNGIRGVSLTAGEDMTLTAQGTAGDIAITSVNARLGELNVSASGHVNLTLSSSYGLNKMVASGNIVLLSTSAGAAMDLQAGGKVDALTMTAMGQLKARAGTGINAMNMSSQSADLDLATTSGSVSSQNAVAATNILMRAPAGISVSNLRTSSGGIDLAAASISGSSAQAHTLLKFVSTGSLSFGRVSSNTTGVQLSASSMDVGAASAITSLSVSTTGNADLGALGVNAPATISAGGQLNLRSLNANGLVTISAVGDASLGQISTVTGDITLSSSAGKLTASSLFAPAAIGLTSSGHMSIGSATTTTGALTASSSLGNVYLGNAMTPLALTVSAPTASVTVDSLMANSATLSAGQDVNVTRNGIVAGVFSVTAGRDTGLAQLMSSGDKIQVSAGRQLGLASATSPTLVSLSAGAGMSVINLNSGGTASLSNTLGTLSLANANVNSSLTMSSGGDLLGSNWLVNAGVVTASAATTMNLKSVIASGLITLQSTGAATLSNVMSERGALVVTSQDQLTISRGLSEQAMDVRGRLGVTASSLISTQNEVKVISSQAGVTLKSASAKTNFAAQSAGNMTITSFNVSDGTAQLTAGQDLTLRTGIASGNLTTSSTGVSTINTLISSAGKVIASAGQALRLTTAVGSAGVELSGTQGLIAKNLISESGAVSLAATAGAISVSNTMARTGLSANTADSLQMTRYSVSQGGANLVAANSMVFKAGSVYGNFSAQAGQSLVLGTLITETGNVLAKSTDANVTFSNLIAYGDVTIEGESASNEGPAIAGSTLMSQTGAVSLTASKGSTSLKSLVASDPSTFAMQAGSLRISRVSGLTRADMTISVQGGTLALPRGF